jgi:hypothetical protein
VGITQPPLLHLLSLHVQILICGVSLSASFRALKSEALSEVRVGSWKTPLALLLVLWVGSCALAHGQADTKKAAPTDASATNSASDDATSSTDDGPPANADPSGGGTASSDLWRYLTSYEFALAVLVLLFGVLVIVSASITLRGRDVTPDSADCCGIE